MVNDKSESIPATPCLRIAPESKGDIDFVDFKIWNPDPKKWKRMLQWALPDHKRVVLRNLAMELLPHLDQFINALDGIDASENLIDNIHTLRAAIKCEADGELVHWPSSIEVETLSAFANTKPSQPQHVYSEQQFDEIYTQVTELDFSKIPKLQQTWLQWWQEKIPESHDHFYMVRDGLKMIRDLHTALHQWRPVERVPSFDDDGPDDDGPDDGQPLPVRPRSRAG